VCAAWVTVRPSVQTVTRATYRFCSVASHSPHKLCAIPLQGNADISQHSSRIAIKWGRKHPPQSWTLCHFISNFKCFCCASQTFIRDYEDVPYNSTGIVKPFRYIYKMFYILYSWIALPRPSRDDDSLFSVSNEHGLCFSNSPVIGTAVLSYYLRYLVRSTLDSYRAMHARPATGT
jgi:hypothetical protein